jgi:branched-chain amino acid transport system permease protein
VKRFPSWSQPLLVFAGAVVLAQLVGLGTSQHDFVPLSVLAEAVLRGCLDALFALSLVLVYRGTRIISFAHGSLGVAAAFVFFTIRGEGMPWALAFAGAVIAAVVAAIAVEALLLRRFTYSPRLVLTVVTIGVGQLLVALAQLLPLWRFGNDSGGPLGGGPLRTPATSPFTSTTRHWFPIVFTGDYVVAGAVTIVVLGALVVFFRRSALGMAIRGAAENEEKVETLGVGAGRLGALTWGITAAMAATATVLALPINQTRLISVGAGLSAAVLLRGLAAAVVGRMDNLPLTFAAALGIATIDRAVVFATGKSSLGNVVLLVIIGVALAAQRASLGRTEVSVGGGWAAAEEIRPVPKLLTGHPAVQAGRRYTLIAIAGAVLLFPFAMSPSQVYTGATIALYGIVVISLAVLTGWGGQISLGQFALVAVGASVGGGLLEHGVPFFVALLLASTVGAGVAVVLGLPALRIKGLFLAVTTLGFAVVMSSFVLDGERFPFLVAQKVPRPALLFLKGSDERVFYFFSLAALAVAIFLASGLRRSRTGRVLIGMRDNERAAQALGISLLRTRLVTFAIAGFLASFAGVMLVAQTGQVHPDAFGADQSLNVFLMAVIGGLGSISGVLTGAIYLGLVQLFVHGAFGRLLASGGGVMAVLLFYPAGLGGGLYALRDAFLRRVALREKIFVPSLLGDFRKLEGDESRGHLAPKPEAGARVEPTPEYTLVGSAIADAGKSQRGKGWVYQ